MSGGTGIGGTSTGGFLDRMKQKERVHNNTGVRALATHDAVAAKAPATNPLTYT